METTNLDIRLVKYLLACSFLNGRSWYNFPKIVIENNRLLVPVVMVEICGDHFERKYIVSNSKNTLSMETFFSIMCRSTNHQQRKFEYCILTYVVSSICWFRAQLLICSIHYTSHKITKHRLQIHIPNKRANLTIHFYWKRHTQAIFCQDSQ